MEIPTYGDARKDEEDPETAVLSTLSSSYIVPPKVPSYSSVQN